MLRTILELAALFLSFRTSRADYDLGFKDDSDLTHFVSRPEIRAPLLNVQIHDASQVTPGYWFLAPYASIVQAPQPEKYYQACQTGPAIYDESGQLIWSGACLFKNQNACDFRPFRANGSDHLSTILYGWEVDPKGRGVVLDQAFQVSHEVIVSKELRNINMHEFNVINGGHTALHIVHRTEWIDVSELAEFGIEEDAGFILNVGFREVELSSGKILFEWWAYPRVRPSASSVEIQYLNGPWPMGWNFFHMNSVDKNSEGDYMISARYTNCIYKISGKDGSIIWQLGGDDSSFKLLDGLNFSKQHDARFVEENSTTTIISFLDNAADEKHRSSDVSSALVVALDTSTTPMAARVLQRFTRPDGELSRSRGNFQLLPNGNAVAGWSGNSYISEHTADGRLLLEARFASKRFVSYRSYKANFTGVPIEPPAMKAFSYGVTLSTTTTVCYVSWNGATEVDSWEFYRNSTGVAVGRAKRTGFETVFQITGYEPSLYAQAISSSGDVLGRSPVATTVRTGEWHSEDFESDFEVESTSLDPLFGIMSIATSFQGLQAKMTGLLKGQIVESGLQHN